MGAFFRGHVLTVVVCTFESEPQPLDDGISFRKYLKTARQPSSHCRFSAEDAAREGHSMI